MSVTMAEHTESIRMQQLTHNGVLTAGDSQTGIHKRSLYEHDHDGVAVCSQKRALCIATVVFATLFIISIIIAYAGPQNGCPCAGQKPHALDGDDSGGDTTSTAPPVPIATNNEVFPWNNMRLPMFVRPLRYNITIHPNLTTLEVKGQVNIEFSVDKDTTFIVFHSKNLTIVGKTLHTAKGHQVPVVRLLEYPTAQQLYLQVKEKLKKGHRYVLVVKYTSRLCERQLEGVYVSSYVDGRGEKRYLATTHFEPTYARAAFPCFDEPHLKARFRLSIFRDRFHIALFNMPVVNTEDVGFYMGTGLLRDDFRETVEMSTYLVAFVVCDYRHISNETHRGTTVSVYTPPDMILQAGFALRTAIDMMDYYEDFFMVPYPLPKQDLIAIPDFAAGAMENWGLITYRETSILYDPEETSTAAHQWVAVVVAHELAHQWFGNLVTMRWWNDVWLNEGVASFLEYVAVQHVMPSWNMMEQFVVDKTQPALNMDALSTSHAVTVEADTALPADIEAFFDTISYSKGAAVLHMLSQYLQHDTVRMGLHDYLDAHKYGNADTKDLWNVFTKTTNHSVEVKTIMDTWTRQMGFPLINVTRKVDGFTATQQRFLMSAGIADKEMDGVVWPAVEEAPPSPFGYKWYVPLSYYTDSEPDAVRHVWMNMSDVKLDVPSTVEWIKVNVNQSGFYRVMYDGAMWHAIIKALQHNHTVFSAADRASLIDDAFTLCRAGLLDAAVPLNLSMYLQREVEYVPWMTALEHLQGWSRRLEHSRAYKSLLEYLRYLLTSVTRYIGWKDTGTHLHKLLRSHILASAVLCNVPSTVREAQTHFQQWMVNNTRVPPNLREAVYLAGIKYGGLKEWQHCWSKYNSSGVASERKLLLKALGVASDPWILHRYLLSTLDHNLIRPQDIKVVLTVVSAHPDGRLLAWRHLRAHWTALLAATGNATHTMASLVAAVTTYFSAEYDLHEVTSFFREMNVGTISRAQQQSIETIQLNIRWVQRYEDDVYEWLTNFLDR